MVCLRLNICSAWFLDVRIYQLVTEMNTKVASDQYFEIYLKVHCYAAIIKIMKHLDAWHPLNNRL